MYVKFINQHKHFHENYKAYHSQNVFNEFLEIINIGFGTKFESLAPVICKILNHFKDCVSNNVGHLGFW